MAAEDMIDIGLDTLTIKGDPTTLYEKLALAQADFVPIPKTNAGQIGKRDFKYAGYATIMRCVRPALAKHGIALLQPLHSRGDNAVTTTILAGHGAAIISSMAFPQQKDPQEFGRHHTYYRRYQLQAALGLEGDKDADDLPDVNVHQGHFVDESPQQSLPAPEPKKLAEPKETKAAPKAPSASAETKPAAAAKQTSSSASPSETSTNGKSKADVAASIPELTADQLKELISGGMRQLKWKMINLREFYEKFVDPVPFPSADEMPLDKMRQLHSEMVKRHGIAPF